MVSTARRTGVALLAATLTLSCGSAGEPTETWGFVATLGSDTTSVERLTRRGDRIVSDAVGRSPLVVRRHWEATLAPDGSVRRWVLDTHVASAPAGEADLHHEVELGDGSIRLVRHAAHDNTDRTYRNPYARTVPWNAFLYGTFELLFQAARGLPDTAQIGQYFFEGWSEGNLGFARVRSLADGRLALTSTGLSGAGVARVDDSGRLLDYSGEGTTYRQHVRRVTDVPDLDALFERFAADERARGVARALSVRDTVRSSFGTVQVTVDYGRPLARGRTLLGGLIPYDRVWRTGANAATHLGISAPVRLGGVPLDRGTYTLWTLPARDSVQLIISRQTGQWGTQYDAAHDVARVSMQVDTLRQPVERFTIRTDSAASRLLLEWGTFRWSVPLEPGG